MTARTWVEGGVAGTWLYGPTWMAMRVGGQLYLWRRESECGQHARWTYVGSTASLDEASALVFAKEGP